ncbi:MAG: hypothetical protein AAGI28_12080 [Pseudomonadota bacterium]
MRLKSLAGTLLALGFALLWLPLGQHGLLYENWMKLGTLMFPFLAFAAFSFGSGRVSEGPISPQAIALMLLGTYIIQQFEEHCIDVFGNTFACQA